MVLAESEVLFDIFVNGVSVFSTESLIPLSGPNLLSRVDHDGRVEEETKDAGLTTFYSPQIVGEVIAGRRSSQSWPSSTGVDNHAIASVPGRFGVALAPSRLGVSSLV